MSTSDFSRKTDAELARFCSATSNALTGLQNKIDASPIANSDLEQEFDLTAETLRSAVEELQSRFQ